MIKISKVLIELIDDFLCIADIVSEPDMGRGEEECFNSDSRLTVSPAHVNVIGRAKMMLPQGESKIKLYIKC